MLCVLVPHRSEEANKAFSAAVQMHDVLVKAWAMWGDYLESIFVKERQLHLGVSAITCYLHACRHQNESKSRKYLAKVSWGDSVLFVTEQPLTGLSSSSACLPLFTSHPYRGLTILGSHTPWGKPSRPEGTEIQPASMLSVQRRSTAGVSVCSRHE